MAKPIPLNKLIHSAVYSGVSATDMYGNNTTSDTDLTKVRFEPVKKTILSNLGEGKDDKFMMFYDCTNSRPKDQEFTQLDKITFLETELTIREVDKLYDGLKLHHLEIYLN